VRGRLERQDAGARQAIGFRHHLETVATIGSHENTAFAIAVSFAGPTFVALPFVPMAVMVTRTSGVSRHRAISAEIIRMRMVQAAAGYHVRGYY
jgi:hypothetical protein